MSKRFRENRYDERGSRGRYDSGSVQLNYDDEEEGGSDRVEEELATGDSGRGGRGSEKKSRKRKKGANGFDDKSEGANTAGEIDLDAGQRSVFPGIPQNISAPSAGGPPLSALEYIQSVRFEARSRPSVVSVVPAAVGDDLESVENMEINGMECEELDPTTDHISHGSVVEAVVDVEKTSAVSVVSPVGIDLEWHTEFSEKMKSIREVWSADESREGQAGGKTAASTTAKPQSLKEWRLYLMNCLPTPLNVRSVSLPDALFILSHCHKWMTPNLAPELSRWVFALLTRLPPVLNGDDISLLREAARKTHIARNDQQRSPDAATKFTADIISSVAASFYGQTDLLYG
ncbi:SMN family protein Yip11 [Sugiyamaella lignohabitans]|uniref:SMN family protein Yip11 n=1 Tax=Sugiyamaella lignohabitans TaxID=796027 RepID=A0A161HKN1_9ASCO|nr:SMN family protein Yip11 [Sugiyamaella lignohabitans]ANB12328.1 SMN family protein Yip11 [Sugiyamaella lignohabitans]